jgi:hypothetical protein
MVGGSARKIMVRLLPKGGDPSQSIGVIPTVFSVPANRAVDVKLPFDAPDTIQVSVHGGPKPWGLYDLGEDNGPATLTGVQRIPCAGLEEAR